MMAIKKSTPSARIDQRSAELGDSCGARRAIDVHEGGEAPLRALIEAAISLDTAKAKG